MTTNTTKTSGTTTTPEPARGMTRGLTFLFAVAGGAAVGNLYWAQPLLATIARSFGVSIGTAGLVVTITQIGYALGVFIIVPLGDIVQRRRVIPALMVLAALALVGTGLAPTFPLLLVALALIGVTTVAGQLLTPLAGDLATDEQRGRVLGTVASGLVLGLLISRALSGLVADLLGWRTIFFAAAVIMVVLAAIMAWKLPTLQSDSRVSYPKVLGGVLRTFVTDRTVRVTMLIGLSTMSAFTLFWTGLTFLFSAPSYGFSVTQIGLVSLLGVAGAIAAQRAGRLFDRGLSLPAIAIGLLIALAALVVSGLGTSLLPLVLISVVLFSVGVQTVQVLTQTRMLQIDGNARSRLNTLFVVGNFIGGAIGSALAGALWPLGGWPVLMVGGACILGFALTVWLVHRTRALAR